MKSYGYMKEWRKRNDNSKKNRYKIWKVWVKNCGNSWCHKILVLLGLANSPSFEFYYVWYSILDRGSNISCNEKEV